MELTVQELAKLEQTTYLLIDMRSEETRAYGMLPGAIPVLPEDLSSFAAEHPGKKLILYCAHGEASIPAAEALCEEGYDAYSLTGGYLAWLREQMARQNDEEIKTRVETSLRKRFREKIWCNFTKAVRQYELVKPGDCIAVCISGGKDSMLMAKLFQELKLHNKFPFEVRFLVMDPGYSPANRQIIEDNLRKLGIPAQIFESDIFGSVYNVEKSPCYLCARMRRGYLYNFAKQLGCNKIALGHHYDDVIETILMGMLYSGKVETMMPKLHSKNFEGMELIRPLYMVKEADIEAWRDYHQLHFIQCACRFTENCATCGGEKGSKRDEMTELIKHFRQVSDVIEYNIFNSVHNINLRTVIGYHKDDQEYNFLDDYDEWGRKDADGEDRKGFFEKSES